MQLALMQRQLIFEIKRANFFYDQIFLKTVTYNYLLEGTTNI